MAAVSSRALLLVGGLAFACATAVEEGPPGGDDTPTVSAGTSSRAGQGGKAAAGSSATAGTMTGTAGRGGASSLGGSGTSGSDASGGVSAASAMAGQGGGVTSGANAGGAASGGNGNAGNAAAGKGGGNPAGGSNGGNSAGGSASGGNPSTACAGIPDWAAKGYQSGDTVANVCSGVYAPPGAAGKSHKFECNPMAGSVALAWCEQREPGVGNGWDAAWVDKGECD